MEFFSHDSVNKIIEVFVVSNEHETICDVLPRRHVALFAKLHEVYHVISVFELFIYVSVVWLDNAFVPAASLLN